MKAPDEIDPSNHGVQTLVGGAWCSGRRRL